MGLHCKLTRLDLGLNITHYGASISHGFTVTRLGSPQMWCRVSWKDPEANVVATTIIFFNALWVEEDHCHPECVYEINTHGYQKYTKVNQSEGYKPWENFVKWGDFSRRRLR
ncbi:hypothetical protein Tsubulata_026630 [Turnera subulata]|uniref:Uncharacterized protein n=1 Tax=Turnera subulata TaxID=218843 RepID=A0A9Q0G689_9ROSI|nr:hypothetical protein Tsubulata_026630 [Turnera subulata]